MTMNERGASVPCPVILLSMYDPAYHMTVGWVYSFCSQLGNPIVRIIVFQKSRTQAMIEFESTEAAQSSKTEIERFYHGPSCPIRISFGHTSKLNVHRNGLYTWDFTATNGSVENMYSAMSTLTPYTRGDDDDDGMPSKPPHVQSMAEYTSRMAENSSHYVDWEQFYAYYGYSLSHITGASSTSTQNPSQSDGTQQSGHGDKTAVSTGFDTSSQQSHMKTNAAYGSMPSNVTANASQPIYSSANAAAALNAFSAPPPPPPPGVGDSSFDAHFAKGNIGAGAVIRCSNLNMNLMNAHRLFNMLCLYGNVHAIYFPYNEPSGTALVQIQDQGGAQRSIDNLNGITVFDSVLTITLTDSKQLPPDAAGNAQFCLENGTSPYVDFAHARLHRFSKMADDATVRVMAPTKVLYFYNTPVDINEDSLAEIFMQAGIQPPINIIMFPNKSSVRSSGVMTFSSISIALHALVVCNHTPLVSGASSGGNSSEENVCMKLCFAKPKSSNPSLGMDNYDTGVKGDYNSGIGPDRSRSHRGSNGPSGAYYGSGRHSRFRGSESGARNVRNPYHHHPPSRSNYANREVFNYGP